MTAGVWLSVALVVFAVMLWPRGRLGPLEPRPGSRRDAPAGGPGTGGTASSPLARVRALLGREVGLHRTRRGWVADFAELAAVGLDAGLPSAEAARLACAVGPTASHPELERLAGRLASVAAHGGGVGDSLADHARGDPDLTFLAAAWQLTDEFGVAAAPAARTAAEVLRERSAADERRTVLAAGPRASMWLLTLLPLSGPLVAVLLGLPVREVYGTSAALTAATVGFLLTGAGWLWSRRFLRRALRPAGVG